MKINNKSKVAMEGSLYAAQLLFSMVYIFHQARRQIALIVGLLGQFADVA